MRTVLLELLIAVVPRLAVAALPRMAVLGRRIGPRRPADGGVRVAEGVVVVAARRRRHEHGRRALALGAADELRRARRHGRPVVAREGAAVLVRAVAAAGGRKGGHGADDADEHDDDVDEQQARGDESLLDDAVAQVVGDARDGARDLVGRDARGRRQERRHVRVVVDGPRRARREGVVAEQREADLGVVVHPGEAFLHGLDLEADEAAHHLLDRVLEDRLAEDGREALVHEVGEDVERVVNGARRVGHVPQHVVVDLVLEGQDDAVGVARPALGHALEARDDLVSEVADLVGQSGHLLLHGGEHHVLAQARDEAGDGEGKHEDGRQGGAVGHGPLDQVASLRVLADLLGDLDADLGGEGVRTHHHEVDVVVLLLAEGLGVVGGRSPAVDLPVSHGDAHEDGEDADDGDEGDLGRVGDLKQVLEEVDDGRVVGAEGQGFLLGHGEDGVIEFPSAVAVVERLLDQVEGNRDGLAGEVLHIVKVGQRLVDLVKITDESRGVDLDVPEFVQVGSHIDLRCLGRILAKDTADGADTLADLTEDVVHVLLDGVAYLGNVVGDGANGLVHGVRRFRDDGGRDVEATMDGSTDETGVGRSHHVDDEQDEFLDTSQDHVEDDHHAMHGFGDTLRSQPVDSDGQVVRHRGHGAAHILHLGAG